MIKVLIQLLQVKKLIALFMTLAFIYMSVTGVISGEQFLTVFTVVVTFYFTQSSIRSVVNKE